jgi:hypothetical protein
MSYSEPFLSKNEKSEIGTSSSFGSFVTHFSEPGSKIDEFILYS